MENKEKLLFSIILFVICVVCTGSIYGQNSIEINLNVSSELRSGLHSPDIQSELELGYKNTFYNIKNDLYLFGRAAGFFQLDNMSKHYTYALDVPRYDYNRYGGSVSTGFILEGPVLNAELGFGLTAHQVIQKKTREGMLPPGASPTSPNRISQAFNTFDANLALMYNVMDLFDMRAGIRLQSPLDQKQLNNYRLSTGIGFLYSF